MEIRSGLFHAIGEKCQCIELRDQFSPCEWFLFDFSSQWKYIDPIHGFLSQLGWWRSNPRLFSPKSLSLSSKIFPFSNSLLFLFKCARRILPNARWSVSPRCRPSKSIYRKVTILFTCRSPFETVDIVAQNGISPRCLSRLRPMPSTIFSIPPIDQRWRIPSFTCCSAAIRTVWDKWSLLSLGNWIRRACQVRLWSFSLSPHSPVASRCWWRDFCVHVRRSTLVNHPTDCLLERIEPSSESSWISPGISRWSSGDQLERHWNAVELFTRTDWRDEWTDSIFSRRRDSLLLSISLDWILDFGLDSISSLGFGVVLDGSTNSSRRSANVGESTDSMCHKSSHGSFTFLFEREKCFSSLGGQRPNSTTDEGFGSGFDRGQSISLGLRDRFRRESRRRRFLLVFTDDRRTSKPFPTETLGLDSKPTDERIDFSLDPIIEHSSECRSTLHGEQSGGLHVVGKFDQWLSLSERSPTGGQCPSSTTIALQHFPRWQFHSVTSGSSFPFSISALWSPCLRSSLHWNPWLRLIVRWRWTSLDRSPWPWSMKKEMKFLFKRLLINRWKCSFLEILRWLFLRCLCRMSLNRQMILSPLLASSIFISLISQKHPHRRPSLFTWKCIPCRWISPTWWFTSSIVPRSSTVLSPRSMAGRSSVHQVNKHWLLFRLSSRSVV